MNRVVASLRRLKGSVGFLILVVAYAVMAEALVQFLLARNVNRQMDFAVTGGAVGVGLVILGGVVLLFEHSAASGDVEHQETLDLAARLRRLLPASSRADQLVAVPDVVVCSDFSYHRADCLLLAGRDGLVELPLHEAHASTRSACDLCLRGLA